MPLDSTGYTPATVEEILADIEADQLALISPSLDTSPTQPLGQANGIVASKIASVEEIIKTAYDGYDVDAVEAVQQDKLYALRGTQREPATKSTVPLTLNLNASFGPYAPGTLFANVSGAPDRKFTNRDTVQTVPANAAYPAVFEATETGPVIALAGSLVITSPVSGWNSLTQATDAAVGRNKETDTAYRLRSEDELSKQGSSSIDALRVDVEGVAGVEQAEGLENNTDVTDSDGLPPHSFEIVLFDGVSPAAANADIFATIWAGKPTGIRPVGTTTGQTPDKTGKLQDVAFTRVTQKNVYIILTVKTNSLWPVDGPAQVKTAIATVGNRLLNGEDVVASKLLSAPFSYTDGNGVEVKIPGVVDVPLALFFQGLAPGPATAADIAIAIRERAIFDTSRITVNVVSV